MEIEELIKWATPFMVLWLTYLTKAHIEVKSKIDVNTALDQQYQKTLSEIKTDIENMKDDIKKILVTISKNGLV